MKENFGNRKFRECRAEPGRLSMTDPSSVTDRRSEFIYGFYTINSLRPSVMELEFKETGPGANRRSKFPVPNLWAKLLEEIRLGHSSTERRPGIANVKNRVRHRRPTEPGPALSDSRISTVCDGARKLLLQRTPTEGSYQQSFLESFSSSCTWACGLRGTSCHYLCF